MSVYYSKSLEDVISSPTPPVDPFPDQIWWNSEKNQMHIWLDGQWVQNTPDIVNDVTKAPIHSPVFTGTPSAPTAPYGTNTNQIASTAFVNTTVSNAVGAPSWYDITSKPATFPPSTHSHPQSEIVSLTTDLAGKAPVVHTHAQADVTNLVTDLAGKAPTVHTHTTAQVTGLDVAQAAQDTAIAGKASTVHTHAQDDITNLTTDLTAKANLAGAVFTGKVTVPATVSNAAGLNIGVNAGAVSAPIAGDLSIQFGSFLSYQLAAGLKIVATLDNGFNWTAKQNWMASAATGASMRIAPGVAPTTPQQGDLWSTSAGLFYRDASVTIGPLTGTTDISGKANIAGQVFTGRIELPASTTAGAPFNIPLGSNPTTPIPGDVWMTSSGMVFAWGAGSYIVVHTNGNQTITGTKTFSSIVTGQAAVKAYSATAIPAGGTAGAGYLVSSTTNFGMFFGSGAPTLAAAKGSIYLRSDGASNAYTYVNTDGSTTWVSLLDTAAGGGEPPIATGTTAQYWRGDKSWQTLDKASVGLTNVDDTSDANKPVSTATTTALNLKAPLADPSFTGKLIAGGITATTAGFNITPNAASPSAPADGDFWVTTTNLWYRINGVTYAGANLSQTQTFTGAKNFSAATRFMNATATPAGGATTANINFGTAQIGIYFGSGVPTVTAVQGSIYLRTDGAGTNTRVYVNTNGTTGWAAMSVIATGTSAPSSPAIGDVWIDTN